MIVAILGTRYEDLSLEEEVLAPAGALLRTGEGASSEGIVSEASDADVILAGSSPRFDAGVLAALKCRGIVRYGVGVDTVDLRAAAERGMWVAYVPDYATEAVSLHALALVLAALRRVPQADARVKAGGWGLEGLRPLHLPSSLTAGVIGFGRIGRRMAEHLLHLGFEVMAHDPVAPIDLDGVRPAPLDEVLGADVVTLHAPGSAEAPPLLGRAQVARLAEGSILVNTARGSLIDEAALIEGLRRGRPAIAALDVFTDEPTDASRFDEVGDRLILTPHMAWYSEESERDLRTKAANEALRILRGDEPLHAVASPPGSRSS